MRYITADHIFPVSSPPFTEGVVITEEDGRILDIVSRDTISEPSSLERHEGIICPGFVNAHCHLELSHMKGHISERTGMAGFVGEFISKRPLFTEEMILEGIRQGEEEMIRNGIVAVGDISNTNHTFRQKAQGRLAYHTFIEVFNLDPLKAKESLNEGLTLKKQLLQADPLQKASIVPHAPYTMSEELLRLVAGEARSQEDILSIHNQESRSESELFISGTGSLFELFRQMGIPEKFLRHTGLNSLRSTLPFLKVAPKILLVHNTFTEAEDVRYARDNSNSAKLFWCTCPNANLYIENSLPDYHMFINENAVMTVGTDSLASNHCLSILEELRLIQRNMPEITLQTLLSWGTRNGAELLNFQNLGTIEKGKRPGLNLLTEVKELRLSEATKVRKLI